MCQKGRFTPRAIEGQILPGTELSNLVSHLRFRALRWQFCGRKETSSSRKSRPSSARVADSKNRGTYDKSERHRREPRGTWKGTDPAAEGRKIPHRWGGDHSSGNPAGEEAGSRRRDRAEWKLVPDQRADGRAEDSLSVLVQRRMPSRHPPISWTQEVALRGFKGGKRWQVDRKISEPYSEHNSRKAENASFLRKSTASRDSSIGKGKKTQTRVSISSKQ